MVLNCEYRISFILLWVQFARSTSPTYLLNNDDPESDIVSILPPKEYFPNEAVLPKITVIPKHDDEATYLLSKLSNQDLIKLLIDQPQKEKFDVLDILKASSLSSSSKNVPDKIDDGKSYKASNKAIKPKLDYSQIQNQKPAGAYFRLNEQEVDPYSSMKGVDPNYLALQKIQNLLHSRPAQQDLVGVDSDDNKEILFDMLTDQLKKLCCKSKKKKYSNQNKKSYKSLLNNLLLDGALDKNTSPKKNLFVPTSNIEHEHMFLIINDELNIDESDDLIAVDPESLNRNSSVLLLGPITTPLTESQLKLVMTRITNELSKPEYMPLLRQIAEGTVSGTNTRLMKSLVTGPETRRYIKPHRCNHQSKLAKIYGGPKWIICTGYLNLNQPSLYD